MSSVVIIAAILLLLLLILLTTVGIDAAFTDGVVSVSIYIDGFRKRIFTTDKNLKKKKKKNSKKKDKNNFDHTKKKKKKKKDDEEKESLLKRLTISEIFDIIKIIFRTISKFRKKIVVKLFKFWFVSSYDDPYKTVKQYNLINTVFGFLGPVADQALLLKKTDVKTATDFDVGKPYYDARLVLYIRIGQILAIVFSAIFAFIKIIIRHNRKERRLNKNLQEEQ